MKVADESQALRLVIQTQQDGRRRSTSPVACGSDQKEEQDGHRRTPSPVACDSDQRQERRSQTNPKLSGLWFRPAAQTPEPRGSWSRRRHNQGADHHLAACSCARLDWTRRPPAAEQRAVGSWCAHAHYDSSNTVALLLRGCVWGCAPTGYGRCPTLWRVNGTP